MKLSLAGWSLHRHFTRPRNPLRLLDFPKVARQDFGLDAIELNNVFFESTTIDYIRQLKKQARDESVRILNIAVDELYDMCWNGWMGRRAVNANAWWIAIASELGCTAIRVNSGGREIHNFNPTHLQNCAENFAALAERANPYGIRILMENHEGLSSDPDRMLKVRALSGNAFDFLPDFGNWPKEISRYEALQKIMPFAHAVHAKVLTIQANGSHRTFELGRCVQIAKCAGYDSYLGIEYEGEGDETAGVKRAIHELQKYI